MVHRPYQLNATCFFGGDTPLIEVHSDRPHKNLPKMLAKRGLTVRDEPWYEHVTPVGSLDDRTHGTGRAEVTTRFYVHYEVMGCWHCPLAESYLASLNIYRIFDSINAKWLP